LEALAGELGAADAIEVLHLRCVVIDICYSKDEGTLLGSQELILKTLEHIFQHLLLT